MVSLFDRSPLPSLSTDLLIAASLFLPLREANGTTPVDTMLESLKIAKPRLVKSLASTTASDGIKVKSQSQKLTSQANCWAASDSMASLEAKLSSSLVVDEEWMMVKSSSSELKELSGMNEMTRFMFQVMVGSEWLLDDYGATRGHLFSLHSRLMFLISALISNMNNAAVDISSFLVCAISASAAERNVLDGFETRVDSSPHCRVKFDKEFPSGPSFSGFWRSLPLSALVLP